MDQGTIVQQHLADAGFTPGPWMVGTSCSYRRILRECGKPVIMPLPNPKGPGAYLSVTYKDMKLVLATPELLVSTVNLVGILSLSLGDHSDDESAAYGIGRDALAAAVQSASSYSMLRKNVDIAPLTQRDLQGFGITPGPWVEDSSSGDKIIVNGDGKPVVQADTHWHDNHPDLAADMRNLEVIAAAPQLLMALIKVLGAIYPSAADLNEAEHEAFEGAIGLVQDVLGEDDANNLLGKVCPDFEG